MNANEATATPATPEALFLDWDNHAEEDARTFSDRAGRVVARLIALGADAEDILVSAGGAVASSHDRKVDADGWFYTGRAKWGVGKTVHDKAYQFAHTQWHRACYIIADVGGVEVGIEISQMRYGKNGKIRPQQIRVGAPLFTPGLAGISDDPGNPDAIAARTALGMTR